MPIPRYGVWKATPTAWNGSEKPDHGHLTFDDGSGETLDAAVNVMSSSSDTRLVYWLLRDFDKTHPLAQQLANLDPGYHAQHGAGSLGLDFLRGGFLNINDGILLSHDAPGESHDILDYINPIMNQAVDDKAEIYLYGSKYDGGNGDGIHDIHMNQGNSGRFKRDNGAYQDGGIILSFSDGHWEGIFLAFAVQAYQTDDRGNPTGPTFAKLMSGEAAPAPPAAGGEGDDTTGSRGTDIVPGEASVSIQAALINPIGPDEHPTSGEGETVFLLNRGTVAVSLEGWTLSNAAGQTQTLSARARLAAHSKSKVAVPDCPLSNKGGRIVLKNQDGEEVDEVRYTKEQARREGTLVYFKQKA